MKSALSAVVCAVVMAHAAVAQNPTATVNVDASANRKPINPHVYGTNFATTAQLLDLNITLNRSGGNTTSTYNWEMNCYNRGNDWYFESLEEESNVAGADIDSFIDATKDGGAEPMITVPMMGWVSKLGPQRQRLASFSIAKYGPQTDNDWQWFPDAGNGVAAATGQYIVGNDPNDANRPNSVAFQTNWFNHLKNTWGLASAGGIRFYLTDNEPGLWHDTHRDIQPNGVTMEQLRQKIIDYGTAVKNVDPGAKIVGPEAWGWLEYLYSGADVQWAETNNNWNPANFADRNAHGGADHLPWLLGQLRQHEIDTGTRVLDYFTVHYYPQGGEFSTTVTTAMQELRNRSTRSLWDPNYTDETWIAEKIQLIPRMKGWVAANYPGLPVGITEYNWGAENHINGATTQADVLGIFGREALDLATRWTTPATGSMVYNSIKMYRNYDGSKSTFGDTSVSASTETNPDSLSVFASVRSADGALTVMAINKVLSGTTPLVLNVANHAHGSSAQHWRLASTNSITQQPSVSFSGDTLSVTLAPQSINLFVIPCTAPSISVQPASTTIAPGQSTTLSVTSPTPAVTYQWYTGPSGNTSSPIGGATSNTLQVSPSSTTQYWVRVANNCLRADSNTATVTVSTCVAPSITQQPSANQTVTPNGPTSLSVSATGTALTYQWYAGASGNTSSPIAGATSPTLNVAPASTSQYWVRVTGSCGSIDSNTATVTVVAPTPSSFYTLTPCRLLDTREPAGIAGGPSLAGGASRQLNLGGRCGLPTTAKSAALNVTVVPRGITGHVTLFPADAALPNSSTINYNSRVRANNAITRLSADGNTAIVMSNGGPGAIDVVIDINGYFE